MLGLGEHSVLSVADFHPLLTGKPKSERTIGMRHDIAKPQAQKAERIMPFSSMGFQKRISSSTGLRSLFLTSAMFERLLGDIIVNVNLKATIRAPCASGRPIIDTTIVIRDANMRDWPVNFKTIVSSNQYHRCLKSGWSRFCSANKVGVGDVVEFRRLPGECITLHARVLSQGKSGVKKGM